MALKEQRTITVADAVVQRGRIRVITRARGLTVSESRALRGLLEDAEQRLAEIEED